MKIIYIADLLNAKVHTFVSSTVEFDESTRTFTVKHPMQYLRFHSSLYQVCDSIEEAAKLIQTLLD